MSAPAEPGDTQSAIPEDDFWLAACDEALRAGATVDDLSAAGGEALPGATPDRLAALRLLRGCWRPLAGAPDQAGTLGEGGEGTQGREQGLVFGPYMLLGRIGEGGMGQVFKARHSRLGRLVALKVLRPELLAGEGAVERFKREGRAAARLHHPNLVTVYDADEIDGHPFLALEHVEGSDLAQVVRAGGPLPPAQACDCVRQAALGLQHAHDKGLVHRDVKPGNLLLAAGVVKVLDLGLALVVRGEADREAAGGLTSPGAFLGTADFVAPEQIDDARTVGPRADQYALGCTLYFLLTGRVPFPGGGLFSKAARHRGEEPAPVEALCPRLPPGLAAVVRRLMAKKPDERFASAAAAAEALAPFCRAGEAAPAAPPRRRAWASVAALLGLLAAVGVVAWKARSGDGGPPRVVAEGPAPRPEEDGALGPLTATERERGLLRFALSARPDDPAPAPSLVLRPNVAQGWFVYLRSAAERGHVVRVVVQSGGRPVAGLSRDVRVPAGGLVRACFNDLPAVLVGRDDAQAFQEVGGPLRLVLLGKEGAELAACDVAVTPPRRYLAATLTALLPADRDGWPVLHATVVPARDALWAGPRCRIDLDVRPERCAGLRLSQRVGSFSGFLAAGPRTQLKLTAENLEMGPVQAAPDGWAYLTADGYERAFVYRLAVTPATRSFRGPFPEASPCLRLLAPAVVAAGPDVPVQVEADNLSPEDVIEVTVCREADGKVGVEKGQARELRGDRAVRYHVAPTAPGGGLLLRPDVRDHALTFDLRGVVGERSLRVRLLRGAERAPVRFLDAATGEAVEVLSRPLRLAAR
jgi:hypothetical protein